MSTDENPVPASTDGHEGLKMTHRCSRCMAELHEADRGFGSTAWACPEHGFDRQIVSVPAWVENAAKSHPDEARRKSEFCVCRYGRLLAESDEMATDLNEAREDAAQLREALQLQADTANTYRDAMEKARASKPLSTDVLRNPPDELVEIFLTAFVVDADRAKQRLANAADWLESQSPPSPAGDDGKIEALVADAFAADCTEQRFAVLERARRLDAARSPAVGLTVEGAKTIREVHTCLSLIADGASNAPLMAEVAAEGLREMPSLSLPRSRELRDFRREGR